MVQKIAIQTIYYLMKDEFAIVIVIILSIILYYFVFNIIFDPVQGVQKKNGTL